MEKDILADNLFGQLTWDYEFHLWRGYVATVHGLAFEVWVETGARSLVPPIEDAKVDRTISDASRTTFVRLCEKEPAVREYLCAEFVPLYAKWHDDEQITPADFQPRLELESAEITSNGRAEVHYGDDNMFYGHCLIAHLDANGVFEWGEMFG